MNDAVTSKFTNVFWFKAVAFTLFVAGATIACITACIANYETYNWGRLVLIAAFSVILIGVYLYVTVRSLRTITAAREGIILYYKITKKQIIIDYADILHVNNYRVSANRDNMISPSYLSLDIELSTGENIIFNENDIGNYDELKEAIREYRFKLR
jgi:hypothetical protein